MTLQTTTKKRFLQLASRKFEQQLMAYPIKFLQQFHRPETSVLCDIGRVFNDKICAMDRYAFEY